LPHSLICTLVGVAANTLPNYFREFQNGGVEALQELDFYRPTSQLDAHQKSLAEHFRAFPVASIAQAQAEDRKTYRSQTLSDANPFGTAQTRSQRTARVGSIPAKADLAQTSRLSL